jgi:thiol-disulfide isomerase/thioredoxin
MGASVCLAALLLLGQATSGGSSVDQSARLTDDLKQTLTLFETLKSGIKSEKEAQQLVLQLNEKLQLIAQSAAKYQSQTKSEDEKAKLAIVRFEALSSGGVQSATQTDTLAIEIVTKYRESSGICPAVEKLTFIQYVGQERYLPLETILKQSKNPEVVASTLLANYFSQAMSDTADVNKFRELSQTYPKTKAGQRAGRIFEYRTKLSLGAPMPELELELLSGYKLKVGSLKGRVVVIDFWGMWQSACIAEMPEIRNYVAKYPSKIAWIGVNTDSCTKAYLTQKLKDFGANWQNVYAGSATGQVPMDIGIIAYPSKIIIDSFGIVRYVPSIRDWRTVLEEALSKA